MTATGRIVMTRLATLLITLLAARAFAQNLPGPPRDDDRRPNIILILADDLGYNELGCYGQEIIRAPNIDRLAAEGVRVTRAYSGSPVCAPTRAVIMTGLHTGHSFIRGNKEVGGWGPKEPEGQWPLASSELTIAERLKELGYATGAFGKWGLGGPGSEGHPNNQGFDHFYGYLCQRVAHNYYPTHLWRNHDVDVLHGNRYFPAHQKIDAPPTDDQGWAAFRRDDYAPAAIADEALTFIRAHKDEPFFLYYASVIPHLALQAPQEWIDRYPRDWDQQPYLGANGYLPCERPRATYAAMISYLDDVVGRLRAELEAQGIADDTIIIFTSDNGTSWVGGVDRAFFNSLGDLRGRKATLWEGGIRVPLIAWSPKYVMHGGHVDSHTLVAHWDLAPTIMALVGSDWPQKTDGVSFAPALWGNGIMATHTFLYWEFPEGTQQQAVLLEGHWKGIRPNLKQHGLDLELYDLETDPSESTNVAADHPDIVAKIEEIMSHEHEPSELFPIPALDGN
jgi:arylsulfatase